MARRAKTEEVSETDRIDGVAHPRETSNLVGQGAALAFAARAIRNGRPPQAWLIGGPPGIGKATLAYRTARYLLRYGATDAGPEDLFVAENDPVSLQVKSGAHPGLLVLKRGQNSETGKPMTVLSVGEIRKLGNFFGLTSGAGGWRVAIIDTADDLNDAAANALLKILEEPPSRSILLLLAHAPARLLPTIRSRCRKLDLRPLADDILDTELTRLLPELAAADRAALVKLAGGSLGAALRLARGNGLEIAALADKLLDGAIAPDHAAMSDLAEKVARLDDGLESFGEFLAQAIATRIVAQVGHDDRRLDRWVALWEHVNSSFGRSVALHLEPRQTILSTARAAARTAHAGPL